jgi:hypothetical protein
MGIPLRNGQRELIMNPGSGANMPQMSMILDRNKNYAPKQDLNKPEKSIQIMQ